MTSSEHVALSEEDAESKIAQRPFGITDFQTHASVILFAMELDADTGEILRTIGLFENHNPPPIHSNNSYASPTPVSDGERVYCHFGSLGTACIDIKSGNVLWKKEFVVEEITGGATSPVLGKNLVYLACDGSDDQYIVALDKATGEVKWKRKRPPIEAVDTSHRRSFSTPLLIEFNGDQQLISPAAQWVISYHPETGEELWRAKIGTGHAVVPRAVYCDGVVYVCTGYNKPNLVAVRVDGKGDVTQSHVLWRCIKQVPEISSPIIVGSEIYFVTVAGVLSCVDIQSGDLLWQQRIPGSYASSPVSSDGRIYFTSKEGVTTVLKAGKKFDEIAKNELFGETYASFGVYQDSFLIRTDPVLYRIKKVELK